MYTDYPSAIQTQSTSLNKNFLAAKWREINIAVTFFIVAGAVLGLSFVIYLTFHFYKKYFARPRIQDEVFDSATVPFVPEASEKAPDLVQRHLLGAMGAGSHNLPFSAHFRIIYCFPHISAHFVIFCIFPHNLAFSA